MAKKKVAAFFDVDGTLLRENTEVLFLRSLWKDRKIGMAVLLKAVYYSILHKMNLLSFDELSHFSTGFMAGWDGGSTRKYCEYLFKADMEARIIPRMREIIESHRQKGHLIVLLTHVPDLIIDNFARALGADYSLCARMEEKNSRLTGRIIHVYYKEKKYEKFLEFSREKGIDTGKSYFYTDSYSDIATFKSVGNPVAVNPDRKLRRYCIQNHIDMIL